MNVLKEGNTKEETENILTFKRKRKSEEGEKWRYAKKKKSEHG